MSFFTLSDHFFFFFFFFFTFDLFLSTTPKGWKEYVGFPDVKLYAESFEKKSLKKSNILEALQTLKIFSFCRFPDTCGQLRKTKIGRFKAEELAGNWGEKILIISEGKNFRTDRKKSLLLRGCL